MYNIDLFIIFAFIIFALTLKMAAFASTICLPSSSSDVPLVRHPSLLSNTSIPAFSNDHFPTSSLRSLISLLTYRTFSNLLTKSLEISLTEGKCCWTLKNRKCIYHPSTFSFIFIFTSLGRNIFCCEFDRSLYHSSPFEFPSPRDIAFCSLYIWVVSCNGGITGHLLS